jgi:hypothetical protein
MKIVVAAGGVLLITGNLSESDALCVIRDSKDPVGAVLAPSDRAMAAVHCGGQGQPVT